LSAYSVNVCIYGTLYFFLNNSITFFFPYFRCQFSGDWSFISRPTILLFIALTHCLLGYVASKNRPPKKTYYVSGWMLNLTFLLMLQILCHFWRWLMKQTVQHRNSAWSQWYGLCWHFDSPPIL